MNHVITTYGGGELFTLIFNGIAALFATDQTGVVMSLIRVGLTVGSLYVVILMLFKSQLVEGLKWFLWVVVATNLLFLPKTTVWVHDPLCNTKSKIDHVPFALGAFASIVSQVGKSITETFESVFSLPDYMPYHKTGTVFASSLMSQVGQFRIVDPVFKGNMERFVNQCVVYDVMIGHKYTLNDLQKTPDIWALALSHASPVLGFLYKEGNTPGTVVTCKAGAAKLNQLWADQITKATALYGTRVNNRTLTASAFNSDLLSGAKLLSGSLALANSATDILKQTLMVNAIEEASNNKLSELGSASNYAATKALLQQRSAYAAAGEIAARTLPLFKNVIEALSYALFIFIVVLGLLPNGYRTVLTYCGILAWTQLWAPLYAVLNLIMTLYGKHESIGHGLQDGLTLLNSSAIINANADMVTLAAWLSVSIPFISYGILKQGAGAFVGLAQHLGSAMQSAASSAAAETVSGNISLGNVSMGTQAYQNTSAFQHNTSPSYTSSQFKSLSPQGIEQSSFADGSQALSNQALSRLNVQIMGTENTSYARQDHLSEATTLLQSKTTAANSAAESASQDTTHFLSSVGKAISSGTDHHQGVSASEAKSLQNFKGYVDEVQKTGNMTQAQAVEAALGASVGTPKILGYGAEIRGSFASSAARQQAIGVAESVAKNTNYSESFDKVMSASKNFSESENETNHKELGRSATASLNKAKSLRDEVSVAQNQVDTISKDISRNEGKSITIQKDLAQPLLEFIAHQPVNPGPHLMGAHLMGTNGESRGSIGYENARRIVEGGGAERDSYQKGFLEQNPQYSIQGVNDSKEKANLSATFDSESAKLKASSDVTSHHAQNTRTVRAQATEADLDLKKSRISRKTEIMDSLNSHDAVIAARQQVVDDKHGELQGAEQASQDKSLVRAVAGNIAKNVVTKGSPLASILPDDFSSQDTMQQISSQITAETASHTSFTESPLNNKENSSPPSAFTVFKARLENESKESQVTQAPHNLPHPSHNPSSAVISNHEQEITPSSNQKKSADGKTVRLKNNAEKEIPISRNTPADSIIAYARPSSPSKPVDSSTMKVGQSPAHKFQPSQQNQANPKQSKEEKSALPPSTIGKQRK